MQNTFHTILFSAVGFFCGGLGALFLAFFPLFWPPMAILSATFFALAILFGARTRPAKPRKKEPPMVIFGQEIPRPEPPARERVALPLLPLFLLLPLPVLAGILTRNALAVFAVLFTCGGLGLLLALSRLMQKNHPSAVAFCFAWTVAGLLLACVIQVWISSPGFSFDLSYCLNGLAAQVKAYLAMLYDQLGAETAAQLFNLSREDFASSISYGLAYFSPTLAACTILVVTVLAFWLLKAFLRRTEFEVKGMGSFDTFTVSRTAAVFYLISSLFSFLSADLSSNLLFFNFNMILSAVLCYGGMSLAAFFINRRVSTPTLRVILLIAAIGLGTVPMFSSLLAMAGLFESFYRLRERFSGGGTYL